MGTSDVVRVTYGGSLIYVAGADTQFKLDTANKRLTEDVIVNVGYAEDTHDATMDDAAQLLSGITAYAGGSKYTGTLQDYTGSINGGEGYIPYYSGAYYIEPTSEIQSISTSGMFMSSDMTIGRGAQPSGTLSIRANGTYDVTDYASAAVLVSGSEYSFGTIPALSSTPSSLVDSGVNIGYNAADSDYYLAVSSLNLAGKSAYGFYYKAVGSTYYTFCVVSDENPSPVYYQEVIGGTARGVGAKQCSYDSQNYLFYASGIGQIRDEYVNSAFPVFVAQTQEEALASGFAAYREFMNNTAERYFEVLMGNKSGSVVFSGSAIRTYAAYYDANITAIDASYAKTVGTAAFSNCYSLCEANIPVCSQIAAYAFYGCRELSSLNCPAVQEIGDFAFCACYALSAISLPSCTAIGKAAFASCTSLADIYMPMVSSIANANQSTSGAFYSVALTSVDLPACSYIGNYAFCKGRSLVSVRASACSVIGNCAFQSCSLLTDVYMPSCVSVGIFAFAYCSSLQSIDLPVCASVAAGAFSVCSRLVSVSIPQCSYVGDNAFANCSALQSIELSLCSRLLAGAFYNCRSLQDVSIPLVRSIGQSAFWSDAALSRIEAPLCNTLDFFAFTYCSMLEYVSMPELLATSSGTNWSTGAFASTGISSVEFPALMKVNAYTFASCKSLQQISLQCCDAIMGSCAFQSCTSLESVYLFGNSVASLSAVNAFASTPMSLSSYLGHFGSIFVPSDVYASYLTAQYWSTYSSRLVSCPVTYGSNISPFDGEVTLENPRNVTLVSASSTDNVWNISLSVVTQSSEHEGVSIPLTNNRESGKWYRLDFDVLIPSGTSINANANRPILAIIAHSITTQGNTAYYQSPVYATDTFTAGTPKHYSLTVSGDADKSLILYLAGIADGQTKTIEITNITMYEKTVTLPS